MESGLLHYDYDKKVVEPSSKIIARPKLTPPEGYQLVKTYKLEDFMKWHKEQKDIIAPQERLDKTIYVSKAPKQHNYPKHVYENLYWLINL